MARKKKEVSKPTPYKPTLWQKLYLTDFLKHPDEELKDLSLEECEIEFDYLIADYPLNLEFRDHPIDEKSVETLLSGDFFDERMWSPSTQISECSRFAQLLGIAVTTTDPKKELLLQVDPSVTDGETKLSVFYIAGLNLYTMRRAGNIIEAMKDIIVTTLGRALEDIDAIAEKHSRKRG